MVKLKTIFDKKDGKKTKKSEVQWPNRKTSYTQIRIEELNCKQIKLYQKRKWLK